jgi:excisionase family DNA binding protein
MSLATTPRTRYVTIGDAAEYLSVTDRTVRNYIARGDLTGYRIGTRAIRVDLRELEALLVPIPTAAVGGRR